MNLKIDGFSRATELANYKIKSIEEGKELVEEINQTMSEILSEMQQGVDNNLHQQYMDLHYDFKSARYNIQQQLASLVKLRMQSRVA